MTVTMGKVYALVAGFTVAQVFVWATVALLLRAGYRPSLWGPGAAWAFPLLVLGGLLLEGVSLLRTLPSPLAGCVTSAPPPLPTQPTLERTAVALRTRQEAAAMTAHLSPRAPRVVARPATPLPGYVCEGCFDAPARVLVPAPWGGEMGVCAACADTHQAGG